MKLLAIGLSVSMWSLAVAQTAEAPLVLRLEECIAKAKSNNISYKAAEKQMEIAKWREFSAKGALLPTAQASFGVQSDLGRVLDPTRYQYVNTDEFTYQGQGQVVAGVELFKGLQKYNQLKKTGLELEAASFQKDQVYDDIRLTVAQNFLNIALAKEQLVQRKKQLESAKEQTQQNQLLFQAGAVPEARVYEAKANQANLEFEVLNSENNLEIAKLQLALNLQLDGLQSVDIQMPDNIDGLLKEQIPSLEEIITEAIASRPSIKAAELRVKSALRDINIARSSMLPSVALQYSFRTNFSTNSTYQGTKKVFLGLDENGKRVSIDIAEPGDKIPVGEQTKDNISQNLGLNVNIPLFLGGQVHSGMQQATLNSEVATLNLMDTRNKVRNQVRQAYAEALAAKKQFELATSNVEFIKTQFEYAQKRNNVGAISNLEYINAQNNFIIANSTLLSSKYTYIFKRVVLDIFMGDSIQL